MNRTRPTPNRAREGAKLPKSAAALPYPQITLAMSRDITANSAAIGTTSAYADRRVEETVVPTSASLESAAYRESIGSIAVARETVMIECGTIVIRNELE